MHPQYIIGNEIGISNENLRGIAGLVASLDNRPQRIDLLRYNQAAGGKYVSCGLRFDFEPDAEPRNPAEVTAIFENYSVTNQ